MKKRMKHALLTGSVVIASSIPLLLTAPTPAAAQTLTPAPGCVSMYESWRYVNASNDCTDTLSVATVYQDGATGLCYTLPSGAFSTVGEGYLGQHGHADHLALCEP
ncbi:hypothetical protein ACFW1F_37340 [Streptomyces bungoensis]|uniref:hypothetical protein n=1 Tax=Streptomyces bungoensis TaxID=285568 RepID=UPI003443CFC2